MDNPEQLSQELSNLVNESKASIDLLEFIEGPLQKYQDSLIRVHQALQLHKAKLEAAGLSSPPELELACKEMINSSYEFNETIFRLITNRLEMQNYVEPPKE